MIHLTMAGASCHHILHIHIDSISKYPKPRNFVYENWAIRNSCYIRAHSSHDAAFDKKDLFYAHADAYTDKLMYPTICSDIHFYIKIFGKCKRMPGAQVLKAVHSTVNKCPVGAECPLHSNTGDVLFSSL